MTSTHRYASPDSRFVRLFMLLTVFALPQSRATRAHAAPVGEELPRQAQEVSVSVLAERGTTIALLDELRAADQPKWSNFRIIRGNIGDAFAVDPTTGALSIADSGRLQSSTRTSMRLRVVADVEQPTAAADPYLSEFSALVLEAGGRAADLSPLLISRQEIQVTVRLTRPVELPDTWTPFLAGDNTTPNTLDATPAEIVASGERPESVTADATTLATNRATPDLSPTAISETALANNEPPAPAATSTSSETIAHVIDETATQPVGGDDSSAASELIVANGGKLSADNSTTDGRASPEASRPTANQPTSEESEAAVSSDLVIESPEPEGTAIPASGKSDGTAAVVVAVPSIEQSDSTQTDRTPEADESNSADARASVPALPITAPPVASRPTSQLELMRLVVELTLFSLVPAIGISVWLTVRHRQRQRLAALKKQEDAAEETPEQRIERLLTAEAEARKAAEAEIVAAKDPLADSPPVVQTKPVAEDRDDDDWDPESLIPEDMLTTIAELAPADDLQPAGVAQTRFDAPMLELAGAIRPRFSADASSTDYPNDQNGDDDPSTDGDAILERLRWSDPQPSGPLNSSNDFLPSDDPRTSLAAARSGIERTLESHGAPVADDEPDFSQTPYGESLSGDGSVATMECVNTMRLVRRENGAMELLLSEPAELIADPIAESIRARRDCREADSDASVIDTPSAATEPAPAPTEPAALETKHDDVMSDYLNSLLTRTRDEKAATADRRTIAATPAYNGPERRGSTPAAPERKPVKSYLDEYMAREAEAEATKSGTRLPSVVEAIGQPSAIVTAAPRPERHPVDVTSLRQNMESFRAVAMESVDQAIRSHRVRQAYGSLASRKLMLAALVAVLMLFLLANSTHIISFGSLNWIMVAVIVLVFSELCLRLQALQKDKHSGNVRRTVAGADAILPAVTPELTPFEPEVADA